MSIITRPLALEWATLPPGRQSSWKLRLTDVRGFARHMACVEVRTEVPPDGLLPPLRRAKPYLYTDDEVQRLLTSALALPPAGGLRRWTYHCLFGLLAVTGLRISEALRLKRDDVDLQQGILTIRDTKFGKPRLVPLHSTTRDVLLNYVARRDKDPARQAGAYFFVAERGGQLLIQYVHPVFWRLSRQLGLREATDHTGPRLHDFRHRSAVETLLRGYRSGQTALDSSTADGRRPPWPTSACQTISRGRSGQIESRCSWNPDANPGLTVA